LSPSQLVLPLGEVGQGAHADPQKFVLLASTQMLLQRFCPVGQVPPHGAVFAMHATWQATWPSGQVTPHLVPSQVVVPPLMFGQGSQEKPQVLGELLSTQVPLHLCWPDGQSGVPGIAAGPSVGLFGWPPLPADPGSPAVGSPACPDPGLPPLPPGCSAARPPVRSAAGGGIGVERNSWQLRARETKLIRRTVPRKPLGMPDMAAD
jgi:hypothetical protein